MKIQNKHYSQPADRKGERGAALIMVLLTSILMLLAGMALITTTSMSNTTAIDSTAEMQAYAGAEAGLDATLNVLRGNIAPDASLGTTKMNFRTVALPSLSNKSSDSWATGTAATARMSGWLNYTYQNPSVAGDWRVPLTGSYAPLTGIAYKVVITDPDDPGPIATRKITTTTSYIPKRLLVRVEGYGPKGAIKRMEMIVTAVGAEIKTPGAIAMAGSPINISLGDSAVINYTGEDMSIPASTSVSAIAVTSGTETTAQAAIDALHSSSQVQPGTAGTITDANSPSFLRSADAARDFLVEMKANASGTGRLFPTKAAAIAAGGLGTSAIPKLTVIDNYNGDPVSLGAGHQGSGLLIVTGNLDTDGNTDFEGIILVLGRGQMTRSGGGNGVIRGTIMVAQFDPDAPPGTPFGSPSFSIAGGGTSTVGYDSDWVRKALDTLGIAVKGVKEYHN